MIRSSIAKALGRFADETDPGAITPVPLKDTPVADSGVDWAVTFPERRPMDVLNPAFCIVPLSSTMNRPGIWLGRKFCVSTRLLNEKVLKSGLLFPELLRALGLFGVGVPLDSGWRPLRW